MSWKRYNALFMRVFVFPQCTKFGLKRVYDSYTVWKTPLAKPVNTLFNLHSISTKVTHEIELWKLKKDHFYTIILEANWNEFGYPDKRL